jgi:hypothetical protein
MSTDRGIKWPLEFYAGRVVVSQGEDHIRESVRQIVAIGKGEYLMKPEFGCDLDRRVFDPVNLSAMVDGDIREALLTYEPRASVNNTAVEMDRAADGTVGAVIDFTFTGRTGQTGSARVDISSGGTGQS